ncbi:MAG: hypothetical protein FJ190_09300 [Gammaproteobacteria bacterium]|nr:hypothetical protein [Gammaproteobacteria bacterium]
MNDITQSITSVIKDESRQSQPWQEQLQHVLATKDLHGQRLAINRLVAEQNISLLDCAAALLYLNKNKSTQTVTSTAKSVESGQKLTPAISSPAIKLVRYRLDLGSQHQLSLTELKKVIVEESGVDIKKIYNVRIQDSFTLVDLPDEMPQEIFHHLKTVEINGKKLDIRRIKARNKKHSTRRRKHHRSAGVAVMKQAND